MTTRQELYDRIRESSKDEVILEEMIRLGFWPSDEDYPASPTAEIKRQGELERELRKLTFDNRQLENVEAIKRKQRQERMEESKRKRAETKERRLKEKEEKAAAWQNKKKTEIAFLGPGYSGGLSGAEFDSEKMSRRNLAHLVDVANLAKAMGISVGLLRFLAFGRKTSTVTHYRQFEIPKKAGGTRLISAPMPKLKYAQRWILDNILLPIEVNESAHGFCPERSIVTNAERHVLAAVVINIDLKDFFPSIVFKRVRGIFQNIGFSESLSTILGMICTQSPTTQVELDGKDYYVARAERQLPQGAPTSPAITNLICRGLDARLSKIANKLGFTYSRYADDITFSSKDPKADVGRAIRQIKHVIADENFVVHPEKTRILRKGRRLEVTGLTVNEKVNVSRAELRKFRAVLHQIEKDGPVGKSWGKSDNIMASIFGYANFVRMVSPEKGQKFMDQVERIFQKHGTGGFDPKRKPKKKESISTISQPAAPSTEVKPTESTTSKKKKSWWKLW